jgi:7-cyano-7-deazaguanine synthase
VRAGLAWETEELAAAARLLAAPLYREAAPMATLLVDMRDIYPATHWAVRGQAPAFDTADEEVYLEGRNVVLLAKASVLMVRQRLSRVLMGPLAGNPFPDATPEFFAAMGQALTLGLAWKVAVETPLASMHKADVIKLGASLGVPFALTLSCMQPIDGVHCGRCSKCRERRDGFHEAGIEDPTAYRHRPER